MSQKLYVGNLPYDFTESELKDLFEAQGKVLSVVIITDRYSGKSKGFGFVEMEDEIAEKAIENLNGHQVSGRSIVVNKARPMRNQKRGFKRRVNF